MTYVCLLITLFNILINQKSGNFGKRKTDSSARERTRKLHISEYIISCAKKRKIFFIPMKVQLITVNSAIPYILKINSTSSSLKKKSQEGEREKEREKKKRVRTRRRRRRKRRRKGGKRGRESVNGKENEKEKEKKEEKEKEEKEGGEKIEKAVLKVLL